MLIMQRKLEKRRQLATLPSLQKYTLYWSITKKGSRDLSFSKQCTHFCLKICEKGFPLCAKAATPLLRNVNAQLQFYG